MGNRSVDIAPTTESSGSHPCAAVDLGRSSRIQPELSCIKGHRMPSLLDRRTTFAAASIFTVGSVVIGAVELNRHYTPRLAFTRNIPEVLADLLNGTGGCSFLALAVATAVLTVHCRKDRLLKWFTASFSLFLFLQMLVNEMDLAPFREQHLWLLHF